MGNWANASAIRCCKDCVPPTRYLGCHDHCERYQSEKEEYYKATSRINRAKAAIRDADRHHYNVVMHQHKINANKGKV